MNKTNVLQLLNWLGLLLVLTLNTLANTLPINGYNTGELSAFYPNLFVPAGFTFSIWGVIYLSLIGFTVFQSRGLIAKKTPSKAVNLIGLWFLLSCLTNASWIVAWHYQQPLLSLAIMFLLLISLVQIYRNLGIGVRQVKTLEKWLVQLPFSLYLGWISVATIANTTAVLVYFNFNGFGLPEAFYAAALILIAGLLGLYFLHKGYDFVYALVIVWACLGIFYKQQYISDVPNALVSTTAAAVGVLLIYRIARLGRSFKGSRAY
jgi:hypothetical protein